MQHAYDCDGSTDGKQLTLAVPECQSQMCDMHVAAHSSELWTVMIVWTSPLPPTCWNMSMTNMMVGACLTGETSLCMAASAPAHHLIIRLILIANARAAQLSQNCMPWAGPPIHHIDLYRLKHPAELGRLALETTLQSAVAMIEWPDRLGKQHFPERHLSIELQSLPEVDHRPCTQSLSSSGSGL